MRYTSIDEDPNGQRILLVPGDDNDDIHIETHGMSVKINAVVDGDTIYSGTVEFGHEWSRQSFIQGAAKAWAGPGASDSAVKARSLIVRQELDRFDKRPDPEQAAVREARPEPTPRGVAEAKAAAPILVKPIPLRAPLPPQMPDGIFDGWLGDMIQAVADATETPPELAASFGLAALATVLQKRFSVAVKTTDDGNGYFEPLSLWPLCAMESGNRKTAAMQSMTAPLNEWEDAKIAELTPLIEKSTSERKTVEARINELRKAASKAKAAEEFEKAKADIADLEAAMPEVPHAPQLYTEDVTPERLGTLLADNGERMAVLSDEGGIFDVMAGRYSSAINIDVFLKGHAGSPVRVDRGSRPPVNLHHPALTLGLSPQPDVLKSLTANREFRGRGLLARFLYLIPSSPVGYRDNDTTPVPDYIRRPYHDYINGLADVAPATTATGRDVPHTMRLTSEAYESWDAFWHEVEAMMRPGGKLEYLKDWGGKLPGAVARIAGLLHCAAFASSLPQSGRIDQAIMDKAIQFGRYLIDHALIAFDLMGADPAMQVARDVWGKIEERRAEEITKADAWRPLRNKYKAKDVDPAFDLLIEHGYLVEPHQADDTNMPKKSGRPPGRRFRVNPVITAQWQ